MNLLASKKKISTIGLDLDDHEFRAVQLVRQGAKASVQAWAIFPRLHPQGENESSPSGLPLREEMMWASSILHRRGFSGSVISCAPRTRDCSQHVIDLPPHDSGAPLEQIARLEVARVRKCDPGDFELGYWALPQRGRSSESMAVACSSPIISDMINSYQTGGLDVSAIDLPELAIMRGVLDTESLAMPPAEPQIDAVLYVSWSSALAVVTLGHRIVYVRRIEHGASMVWAQATERFGLSVMSARAVLGDHDANDQGEQLDKIRSACWSSLAKELASELDVALAYVSHGFRMAPLGRVVMCGYGSANATVTDQLDQVLGIPMAISAPGPIAAALPQDNEKTLGARLTLAYGLAARFDT